MAKRKERTFESTADGPITVSVFGAVPVVFEPGKVRTYTTENPVEIAALEANPDLKEVKQTKSSKK